MNAFVHLTKGIKTPHDQGRCDAVLGLSAQDTPNVEYIKGYDQGLRLSRHPDPGKRFTADHP